jgi:lysozyme
VVRRLPSAAAVLVGAVFLAPGGSAAAAENAKGIDVSNHQGQIRWGKVPDRIEFAFIKATESTTFVDSYYRGNRRGAKRQGKQVGAYHFARPGGRGKRMVRRDARAEARFFYRVAQPRRGELLPVLDLETTGGLGPKALIRWTRSFLETLRGRVREKPMIYTSPYFWRSAMDNTTRFARNGYEVLWIAHWGVRRPDVPARNWAGHGWTFWQYSDCGSVRGIRGCVDMNRYRGRSFARVKIG